MCVELKTVFWDRPGERNTEATLKLAFEYARLIPSRKILVPSTRGVVAKLAYELKPEDVEMYIFTHHVGYYKDDEDEFDPEMREMLERAGIRVITMTHAFAGIDRGFRKVFGGIYPTEIFALALRTMGEGTKVALELAAMAADAGIVRTGELVVTLGGTARGVDTAWVVKPAHTRNIWAMRPVHIICRPLLVPSTILGELES